MKRAMPRKWKIESLPEVVAGSGTLSEVLENLGLKPYTATYESVKRRIVEMGLDVSHFRIPLNKNSTKGWLKDEEVFVSHGGWHLSNARLKDRLRLCGVEEVCTLCGQIDEWQGKKLVLVLDHINGDKRDNSRGNLRLLCPNCNSQTDTFSGRNRGKIRPRL